MDTALTAIALALPASELAGERAGQVLGTALAIKMVASMGITPVVGTYASRPPRRALSLSRLASSRRR